MNENLSNYAQSKTSESFIYIYDVLECTILIQLSRNARRKPKILGRFERNS